MVDVAQNAELILPNELVSVTSSLLRADESYSFKFSPISTTLDTCSITSVEIFSDKSKTAHSDLELTFENGMYDIHLKASTI